MISRYSAFWLVCTLFVSLSVHIAGQDTPHYLDSSQPAEVRVEDLLSRMTLAEKIGQMTLIEKNSITTADIAPLGIGALLSGGGGYPSSNTPAAWADMVRTYQEQALQSRLGIPLLYGVDAIHGHNNVRGAVIFPHAIGLGAAGDAELVRAIARVTARDMLATGIHWNYAPVLATTQDIRWGRTYETFGEDVALVTELGLAFMVGLQGDDLVAPDTVLATPKHFLGDGGTLWGSSATEDYLLDQGVTLDDERALREVYLPPYEAAVDAGALSIMISFSSWGPVKMHAQAELITGVLKGELGFSGFVVSDWGGIDQIDADYSRAVITAINAGVDMNMVPYDYHRFIAVMLSAVQDGHINEARIDDAVRRILRVKFELGLFEEPFGRDEWLALTGGESDRELARQAVQASLVLLKNEDETLPLGQPSSVFVAGVGANDIGMQSGGWTIEWQGAMGPITSGTTILDALRATLSEPTQIYFNRFGRFDRLRDDAGQDLIADVGIVVVGEEPYAEGRGDRAELTLTEADRNIIRRVGEQSQRVVLVLITGRPLIISDVLDEVDAVVVAWLPGTEGQGVVDVLLGEAPFRGRLPIAWPSAMMELPTGLVHYLDDPAMRPEPLFPLGYGLTTP